MDFSKYKKVKMSDSAKSAKMSALSGLKDEMKKLMSEDLKGMKKVTVASPDSEGLEAGLEKAKELVEGSEELEESEHEMPDGSMMKDSEMEGEAPMSLEECDSPEEIDTLIKKLEEKKAALASK